MVGKEMFSALLFSINIIDYVFISAMKKSFLCDPSWIEKYTSKTNRSDKSEK